MNFVPQEVVTGDISWENIPGKFVAQDNNWKILGTQIVLGCPGIGRYFYTYDDTDLISLHAKGYVRYGMFLYIRLQ